MVTGIESIVNSRVADEPLLSTPADMAESTIDTVLGRYFSSSPCVIWRIRDRFHEGMSPIHTANCMSCLQNPCEMKQLWQVKSHVFVDGLEFDVRVRGWHRVLI